VYLQPKHDKFFVARYLRARKYDVKLAVQMFVNTMKWREEINIPKIMQTFPKNPHYERLVSYWPYSYHWEDPITSHDGSIVLLQALGRADPSIVEIVGMDTLVQFHIWCMEMLENMYWKTVAEKGYWPGFILIDDFEGVGYHTFSPTIIKVAQEIVRINQNYYPEMLRKMYILNVPSTFYFSWRVFQRWIEPRSLAKMELINGNATLIKDKLFAIFDVSKLPVRLGGTSTRDIPKAGPVEFIVKLKEKAKNRVDIARGSKHVVTQVFNEGEICSWEFKTKNYDVGFGVNFLSGDSSEVIVPYERIGAFNKVIKGSFMAEKTGEYEFQWDNTYSWTRGKSLKYNLYKGDVLL